MDLFTGLRAAEVVEETLMPLLDAQVPQDSLAFVASLLFLQPDIRLAQEVLAAEVLVVAVSTLDPLAHLGALDKLEPYS